jgi:hypothetical protein
MSKNSLNNLAIKQDIKQKTSKRVSTWKPIGSVSVNPDGYRLQKVSDTGIGSKDWQFVHRLIWQEAGREIPPGSLPPAVYAKSLIQKSITLTPDSKTQCY